MILIRPLQLSEAEQAQQIYNHPSIIGLLGGLTHLETIKGKIKSSGVTIWGAFDADKIVGSTMIAGRNQCHYAKFGEVGVLPEYRRQRIGTCLYIAMLCQGILEGRRLWEDTIVGDNPNQFKCLPTIGLEHWAVLKMKTASFKDIHLFGYNLTFEKLRQTLERIPRDIEIIIREDYYSDDLWKKNYEIYEKKNKTFLEQIENCRFIVKSYPQIKVIQGKEKCPHNQGKEKQEELVL